MKRAALGPVMLDIRGQHLVPDDVERLKHPLTGAVILFARNYENPEQVAALCRDIRRLREPALLIAVDHEGGRVQRFREGFSRIPPMRALGTLWDRDPAEALRVAREAGLLIALELGACGMDFSFAPVLDLDYGNSGVIGDRAFHRDADAVSQLAGAFVQGLRSGGMASVGKHFPGHGFVAADSHIDIPVDERPLADIEREDLVPFMRLAANLHGIMPAHVIYPKVDPHPAGFSRVWMQKILRERLGFQGVIFSDDLTMEGASVAGDVEARARAALAAGCDMVLVCNQPDTAGQLLQALEKQPPQAQQDRLAALYARPMANSLSALRASGQRLQALAALQRIDAA
jgi:beta-N-acetylhexosaminidase